MKHLFLLITALLLSHVALSQDWNYLFSDGDSEFYIQEDSGKGGIYGRKLWVKMVAPKIEYYKNGKTQILNNGFLIQLMVFDCRDREYNLEKRVYYNSKGTSVFSESFISNGIIFTPWQTAIPGSVAEKFVKYMCGSGEVEKYLKKYY